MRRICIALGVLAIVAPATAGPISYSDTWDSYAVGTGDANYLANWPAIPGQVAFPVTAVSHPKSAPHSLLQQSGVVHGIQNNLADGVEMPVGSYLMPTADSPLKLGVSWNPAQGTNRRANNFVLELAMGGTPLVGVSNCKVVGGDDNNPYFFNGSNWSRQTATVFTSQTWSDLTLTLTPSGSGYSVALKVNTTTINLAIPYTGGFDTIRIRSVAGTTLTSWVDNVFLTGGNIVPEPAVLTLLLLGLPCIGRGARGRGLRG